MRRLVVVLAGACCLWGAGCEGPPDMNPCADFDCSGHGTCVLAGRQGAPPTPTCRCDTGYAPDSSGWLCLPATDSSLCAGVACSGHGRCVSVRGTPGCVCDPGYAASGSDGLACTDVCAGVSCSGHGSCRVDSSNQPLCVCDPGYEPGADRLSCAVPAEQGPVVYRLAWDSYPTYLMGRASIDTREAGRIVEVLDYNLRLDSWRGLRRKARQQWTLDATGKQVTAFEWTDHFRQGTLWRKRAGKATFAAGAATVSYDRAGYRVAATESYGGSQAPIPMLGGFEYPGVSLGCFSPGFYLQALQRYQPGQPDPQDIEVFWPETGTVGQIKVKAAATSTAARPVLVFPDYEITVTYGGAGMPETIYLDDQSLGWRRMEGVAADLNLGSLAPGKPYTPKPLPSGLVESSVSISAAGGATLAATLTVPKGASGKVPAVLLVAGPDADSRDRPWPRLPRSPLFEHLAAHLAGAGFASLRFDLRGRGASTGSASGQSLSQLTQDVGAALAALKAASAVDGGEVYLLSHGWGSVPALSTAGSGIKGLIAIAPVIADLDEVTVYAGTSGWKVSGFSSKFVAAQKKWYEDELAKISAGTYTGTRFLQRPVALWKDLLAFDGTTTLGALSAPVLLLRGDQDLETPPEQLKAAAAAAAKAGKKNLTTSTLKGLSFILSAGKTSDLWESAMLPLELPATATQAITDWLKKN